MSTTLFISKGCFPFFVCYKVGFVFSLFQNFLEQFLSGVLLFLSSIFSLTGFVFQHFLLPVFFYFYFSIFFDIVVLFVGNCDIIHVLWFINYRLERTKKNKVVYIFVKYVNVFLLVYLKVKNIVTFCRYLFKYPRHVHLYA